jgi:uncharacterized membrane protein
MRALDDLAPTASIRAMQAINLRAPNPLLMIALLGTAALSVVLVITAVVRPSEPGARLRLVGGIGYLIGIAITAAYHIPKNNGLATVDPARVDAARTWTNYSPMRTLLNHVRTATSLGAMVLLATAVRVAS